jgi:hypothetical protein
VMVVTLLFSFENATMRLTLSHELWLLINTVLV